MVTSRRTGCTNEDTVLPIYARSVFFLDAFVETYNTGCNIVEAILLHTRSVFLFCFPPPCFRLDVVRSVHASRVTRLMKSPRGPSCQTPTAAVARGITVLYAHVALRCWLACPKGPLPYTLTAPRSCKWLGWEIDFNKGHF